MAAASDEAYDAVMRQIKASAERISSANAHESSKATALRDLAAAWRHLHGGPQPGGAQIIAK